MRDRREEIGSCREIELRENGDCKKGEKKVMERKERKRCR